ncbi:serine/threonine dehydratase [Pseudomaricurvus alkylphenolicus]|uniref:serine/threonine dehydratase n=1 Tax=Pseudomaricurvus alkylphenolicus TaxID=1306991 RepID=UPI00142051E6|nr:serine/threonine dehydratase [Pseudomaricurvus alkylphenolicus]NIB38455.1 serine/threonine dehydratase [Pseudomaricurvus alkylphenolicus]
MICLNDVQQAQRRIAAYIHKTPVVTSKRLNDWLGHSVYFKAECLQKVGAFKARGACNTLAWLIETGTKPKHVVSNSSGNHAQAVAWSARQFNIPATIYMPRNVSRVKAKATAAYGAEVVFCESRAEADQRASEAAVQTGTFWIPPFNHEQVIAGQGTAAYEALEHLHRENKKVNAVFAPCGGGGILSGSLISTRGLSRSTSVIGAEPLKANDAAQSLRRGEIVRLPEQPVTLADGAMPLSVGDITFDHLKQLDDFFEIGEESIAYWTQWISHLLKLHVEPTSAMSMEAVRQWLRPKSTRQTVLVILTGGNIDHQMMSRIWQEDYLSEVPTCQTDPY